MKRICSNNTDWSNSNPINVPKQLSLCPCQVNKWKWFPKQRRWLNLTSEASRLCLLFSWRLYQTGATSSAKNTHFQAKWWKFWRLRLTGRWWKLKRFWNRVLVPIIARIFQPVTVPCHPAIEAEGSGWLFLESLLSRTVPNSSASAGAQLGYAGINHQELVLLGLSRCFCWIALFEGRQSAWIYFLTLFECMWILLIIVLKKRSRGRPEHANWIGYGMVR